MADAKSLYELFILGRLMTQAFHGYLLRYMLGIAIGPTRQISWGVLYPLIRRLEENGLIVALEGGEATAAEGEGGERQRRLYQLTEAGRARFYELVMEPGEFNADYEDAFAIKLSFFAHLSREQQRTILRHYREYLLYVQNYTRTARERVAKLPAIREVERPHYLRMLDHKLYLLEQDLAWVDGQLADMTNEA